MIATFTKPLHRLLCPLFLAAGFLFLLPVQAFAAEEPPRQRVFDYADLLTAEEEAALELLAEQIRELHDLDAVVLTVDGMEMDGQPVHDIQAFAADFYDFGGFNTSVPIGGGLGFGVGSEDDGFLFVIDMDSREVALSTNGKAVRLLTDSRVEDILDFGYGYLAEGDYAGALTAMLRRADSYCAAGIPNGQYNYDSETGEIGRYRSLKSWEVLAAVLAALVVGVSYYRSVSRSYAMQTTPDLYNYRDQSEVKLTGREDRFLNQFVTTRRISRSSGSGGGSSSSSRRSTTRRSSSGRSHGGGSRKF